jgi:hypothetical protein
MLANVSNSVANKTALAVEALLDREADELTPACIERAKTRDPFADGFGRRPEKPQERRHCHAHLVHDRTHQCSFGCRDRNRAAVRLD